MKIEANISRRRRHRGGKLMVSPTWYLRHKMPGEAWSKWRNLGVRDKQVADEMRLKFVREAEREAHGLSPTKPLRDGAVGPLADALAEYKKSIESTRDGMYVYNVGQHVTKLLKECGWKIPRDVTAGSFESWHPGRPNIPKR